MTVQQLLMDGLLRAVADPRFQELVDGFYAARGGLEIREEAALRSELRGLLRCLCAVLGDQAELLRLSVGGPHAAALDGTGA